MEHWILTRLGREQILPLQRAGNEEDVRILKLLDRSEGATVEQIAYAMKLDENVVQNKLRLLSEKKWVWRHITKAAPF